MWQAPYVLKLQINCSLYRIYLQLCDAQLIGKFPLNLEVREWDLSLCQPVEKHTFSHRASSERKNAFMP